MKKAILLLVLFLVTNRTSAQENYKVYTPFIFRNQCSNSVNNLTATRYGIAEIPLTGPNLPEDSGVFLDYAMEVTLISPTGTRYYDIGYYNGNGQWLSRFMPDREGAWFYCAKLYNGQNIAVQEDGAKIAANTVHAVEGVIQVSSVVGTGFMAKGELLHRGAHYLQFADNAYYLKTGTNSPENLLAYAGIDNTVPTHSYAPHVPHWNSGDPTINGSQGLIGALNYLGSMGVNSVYALTMNLGGDANDVYPWISPATKVHYDTSKLEQWHTIFLHAMEKEIMVTLVLGETEEENTLWLDNGELGPERRLYYRELIARFDHLPAIKYNISEENDYSYLQTIEFITYMRQWTKKPITFHTNLDYLVFQVDAAPYLDITSIQYRPEKGGDFVEELREADNWVVDMDEQYVGLTNTNAVELRKSALYPVLFSGGNIEWYAGWPSDVLMENFSSRETMWRYQKIAADLLKEYPFWTFVPQDWRLDRPGEVFTDGESVFLFYLPYANDGAVARGLEGNYSMHRMNPGTGARYFVGDFSGPTIMLPNIAGDAVYILERN